MPKYKRSKNLLTTPHKQLSLLIRNFCIPLCRVSQSNEISCQTKSYIVFYALGLPNYISFSLRFALNLRKTSS